MPREEDELAMGARVAFLEKEAEKKPTPSDQTECTSFLKREILRSEKERSKKKKKS